MKRVTGIGGIFFKSDDPEKLYQWYETHLGIKREHGYVSFEEPGLTTWSVFKRSSDYFDPSPAPFMINYRVDDLDALLEVLRADGVEIDPKRDESFGKFAWIYDPDGNKIELWEPEK